MKISLFITLALLLVFGCSENPTQPPDPPPSLVIISPDSTVNLTVPEDYVIRLEFSTDIDPTSVNTSTFVVRNIYGNDTVIVAGTRAVSGKNMSFTADAKYRKGSVIKVILNGIKSVDGVVMKKSVINYLVEGALVYVRVVGHYPANNAVNVALGDSIVVVFDSTIAKASIWVKADNNTVLGTKVINGNTLTFDPLYDFKSDNHVVVTVYDVSTATGYTLKHNYTFAFDVEHIDYVKILQTDPADNATDVKSESNIVVQFDREISSADISVKVDNVLIEGVKTINNNEMTFNPDKDFSSDAEVVYTVSNVIATDGNVLENPVTFSFTVEHIDMFPVPKGFFTNVVYVDNQGKIYFGGDSLLRYLPNGKLDKTAPFGSVSDIAVTDNGNVYIAADAGVIELSNDLTYIHTYQTPVGRLVAAHNDVYMTFLASNVRFYLSNILTGVSRETGFYASYGIIFDADKDQIVVNGQNNGYLITKAYTLDLELVWEQYFTADGNGALVYALVQNNAGNYLSFGYFVNNTVYRLEYASDGTVVDTLDIGPWTIRDAKPSPVHDIIVVRKDLGYGDRVAVQSQFGWYIATQGGDVRFFDINTKVEIRELRRGD